MNPDDAYLKMKMDIAKRFNLPIDLGGGEQVSGPTFTGTTQGDRFRQQASRAVAPATAKGILQAGANALGILGSGAVTTGIGNMAEIAGGVAPGTYGGFQNIEGAQMIPPERRRLVDTFRSYHEAANAALNGGNRNALDSHGQVRGGGTGSARGGITAGGPR